METLPQSHRQAFVSILLDRIGMPIMDVQEVTQRLSPLFDIVEEGGVYPLSDGDRFVPEALASQMRELTGRDTIRRAVILSRDVLVQERTRPSLLPLYAEPCFTAQLPEHEFRLIPSNAAADLVAAIQHHILSGISEAMVRGMSRERSPIEVPQHEIVTIAMQNVFQMVFSYCSAALLGNRERMEELDMPIAFIASIIPLGLKQSDLSTFLYLGA